jgi:probable HAF family extracellular repeat protein
LHQAWGVILAMSDRKLAMLIAALSIAAPAEAQEPVYWPAIQPLFCGTLSARAINDQGQVAGVEEIRAGEHIVVLWTSGEPVALPTPGTFPVVLGLDDDGSAVGMVAIEYQPSAVLWQGTEARVLPFDVAIAIDGGRIVGRRRVEGGMRAVLWADGEVTDLGDLGGGWAEPLGVRGGRIVGFSRNAQGDSHAFLWEDGRMHDLGTLGGRISRAHDVNARGQVVGFSETEDGSTHAFLWERGRMRDLGAFGAEHSAAVSIDDEGRILANVIDRSERRYAVLVDGSKTHKIEREDEDLEAHQLNGRGQVVVTAGEEAFVWENGELQSLLRTQPEGCAGLAARFRYRCSRGIAVDVAEDGTVVGDGWSIVGEESSGAFAWKDDTARYLGTLGGSMTQVRDVNATGAAVGTSADSAGTWQAFLWEGGEMRSLLPLQEADAINDAGQVVGRVLDDRMRILVAIWEDDSVRLLPTLPGRYSQGYDISETGIVAGFSEAAPRDSRAVLWRDGEIVELGTLGGPASVALAINERGTVVGWSTIVDAGSRAFVWDEVSGIRPLAGLEDIRSAATDVTESGVIVGWMEPVMSFRIGEFRQRRAFRWENGVLTDLGDLDVIHPSPEHATEALAINEQGVVVGVSASTAFLYRDGEMLSLGEPCSDALTPHAPDRLPRPARPPPVIP